MRSEFLLTGGTGKTGRRLAKHLRARGLAPRVASRTPSGNGQVRFDWADGTTFDAAFRDVEAIYLVAPTGAADPLEAMRSGIDRAVAAGVRRFVLLSASSLDEDGPMMGRVHRYLHDHAPEWVVLRPTWFMQNLSEQQHFATIRDERAIYSATGDGRVAFIDADDIAAVAAVALVDPALPSGELLLTGPEALSYDDVAAILSAELETTITHRKLDEQAMAERFLRLGLPREYAELLAAMDSAIAQGGEDRVTDTVERLAGQAAISLSQFTSRERDVWLGV